MQGIYLRGVPLIKVANRRKIAITLKNPNAGLCQADRSLPVLPHIGP